MKGRAAEARDLVLSAKSCSEPITSLGLMMSQSSITGPAEEINRNNSFKYGFQCLLKVKNYSTEYIKKNIKSLIYIN